MTVDISRKTFAPRKNYGELVSMQGRVVTDAPLNEAEKIVDRRFRAETIDLVGFCGYSFNFPDSFRITVEAGGLMIGPGRYYVDGLLAENFGAGDEVFDAALEELRSLDPVPFGEQPYRPGFVPALPEDGRHLIYLDVWKRAVTFLEDPDLIDPAIGVDTTARLQTVWQVRDLDGLGPEITCETPDEDIPGWPEIIRPSDARLTSRANPDSAVDDPCLVPPEGGYRGLENRTYLVCLHDVLPDGTVQMKWSRTNGTVATRIVSQPALDTLTVGQVAKDDYLRFNNGDWVEVTDDQRVFEGVPGTMARVLTVDDATDTIVLEDPLPAGTVPLIGGGPDADPGLHPLIRRWDQSGIVLDSDGSQIVDLDAPGSSGLIPLPALGTFIALEDGVEVAFDLADAAGVMHPGDCWSFISRYADASVEVLAAAPPQWTHHHYCRLALVDAEDGEFVAPLVSDCRDPFAEDCCCTVVVRPGQDVQTAIDSLPVDLGGCVCLKPGRHEISAPLRILTSNVTLRGETQGAVLRNTAPGPVIEIGDVGLFVSGVHVTTLQVEQSGLLAGRPAALHLRGLFDSVIEHCTVEAARQGQSIGITLADCTDVIVRDCRIRGADIGIWGDLAGERHALLGNSIESDESVGAAGIAVSRLLGPVRIFENRIAGYANGIIINAQPFGGARFSNATGSIVENNRIRLESEEGEGESEVGIDTACDSCTVTGNRVTLSGAGQTGIRATGSVVKILANMVDTAPGAAPDDLLGIEVGEQTDEGANLSVDVLVQSNSVAGAGTGIAALSVADLKVLGNTVSATRGATQIGILLEAADNSEIMANRIRDTGLAISSARGRTTQIEQNQIEACAGGILCNTEIGVDVSHNRIEDCQLPALIFIFCLARCAAIGNRISNVASLGLPGVAIGAALVVGEYHVEANEILNTGVPLDGPVNPNLIIGILGLFVLEARIESNLVTYSTPAALQRTLEDRALLLQGLFEVAFPNQEQGLRLGFAAQITNNKFVGPGRSALVQVPSNTVNDTLFIRFERVFFNHNYCDHFGGEGGVKTNATVMLSGFRAVVMGNQIKATNRAHASINFFGTPGPCMGNVTASGIIDHPDFPAPNSAFNMIA